MEVAHVSEARVESGFVCLALNSDCVADAPRLWILAAGFFVVSFFFVYRSFYGMRIKGEAAV